MNRAGFAGSTLGAVLLAVLLMRAPATAPGAFTGPPQGQSFAGQNSAANQAGDDSGRGPWDASRRHFAGFGPEADCVSHTAPKATGHNQTSPTQAASQKTGRTRREQIWCIPPGEQVRAMIAIVPDPVHSHMSLVYDRSVEALQLAAESVGYVIDRYWLPWATPAAKNSSVQQAAKDAGEKDSEPGLLMFRWNGDARQNGEPQNNGSSVLYVFLVSDTSTAGINGEQFSNAVKYIGEVCGPGSAGCGGKSGIRILGPTFSGSLDSLRRLTEHWSNQSFRAYSGTVSTRQAQVSLHVPGFEASQCREGDKGCTEPPLRFRSLVTDSETAVDSFLQSLKDDNQIDCDDHPEVAIFSEAATTYGGAARRGAEDGPPCYASFSFPREIASLRNAYQQAGRQPSSPDAGSTATAQNYLPFNLADTQPNRSDEPPVASLQQGPLSQEAVLMKFANELRREHYRYVGIIGSNVLDVLFLASFLRNACPDVRVFVLSSDLLMERDSDNVPYIGMLSLSTYPLIARNLYWTGSGATPSRLPFADQYQQGQYNAALLAMSEEVPQALKGRLYEFRQPFTQSPERFDASTTTLPLWVSVVGTGGFWPVKIIPPNTPGDAQSSEHPVMAGVDYTGAWKAIAAVLCALAFFYVLVLWTVPPMSSRFRDLVMAGPVCGQRLFFANLISANLALGLAMAATPAWRFGLHAGATVQIIAAVAPLAIAALFLTSMRLSNVCCGVWRNEDKTATRPRVMLLTGGITLGLWISAFGGEWLWWSLFTDGRSHYGFFFAYRTVHLATGVSPLTPLLPLFAAFCIWSVCELWRLRFNEQLRPRLGVSTDFPGAFTEVPIVRALNKYLLKSNYVIAFVLIFVLWLFFFKPRRPFQLFEDFNFGLLYEILFSLVVMLMLSAGLRLGQVWSETKKLLGELQRSPIRYAFSRLKGASWSPIWQSGGQDAEWLNLSMSFEVLGQIKLCRSELSKDLSDRVDNAEAAKQAIIDLRNRLLRPADVAGAAPATKGDQQAATTQAKNPRELAHDLQEKYLAIQKSLAAVLDEALKTLTQYWDEHGPGEDQPAGDEAKSKAAGDKAKPQDDKPPSTSRLEEYVALRYVAFIRGVMVHIKHLLVLLAIIYSLALISLNLYSFEPHQSLIWSFTAIFALIGLAAAGVLAQAHRDEILSRVSGTKPNELGLGFYVRVISLGAAPLVTLLATHFPAIGKLFWSIFQPGLEALK